MQRIGQTSKKNQACQPTDESALSLCADTVSKNAPASNMLLFLADAAVAVSVFAFFVLFVYSGIANILFDVALLFLFSFLFRLYALVYIRSAVAFNVFSFYIKHNEIAPDQ